MKKVKSLICIALMGLPFTSCKDYLTLMPLNEVVLENYWTDKSDVESVLLGTYAALETSDCITRMAIWGEMRSDNIIAGKSTPNDILQITKDNILETNSYMSWKCFYDVINRANTVLHFAPIVASEDPNYTKAELQANLAEAVAIRSLCYWYLIRAYKDVPFVDQPSMDDTSPFVNPVEADSFNVVLDKIINDLEEYKKYAVNKYAMKSANTGRITRSAIYAMLADMYLWKGDYDKCIENAELVTERKVYEYEELEEDEGPDNIVELFSDKWPLIQSTVGTAKAGTAYNSNFGEGNSFEVLFELAFQANQETSNSFVSSYYGSRNTTIANIMATPQMYNNFEQGNNKVFTSKYDGRFYESMRKDNSSGDYGIAKYVLQDVSYNLSTGEVRDLSTTTRSDNQQPNWVIYRYTDVLLMEAEAKVLKAMKLSNGGDPADNETVQNLTKEAFALVNVVNKRAICYPQYVSADTLKYESYSGSLQDMENLVMDERRRELCFEGKRWFDLVRMARRDGNTKRLSQAALTKYTENVSAVRIKLADMDAIYFPYSKDERKVNTLLKQNPAYVEDEFIKKDTK